MAERLRPLASGVAGARVLVTAASQGIGYAVAQRFLSEGARVVVNGSNPPRLAAAVHELSTLGEVHGAVADLRQPDDMDRLVRETRDRLGAIDTLVYVTGSPRPGTVLETDFATWLDGARLLSVGPAYLARQVAAGMLKDGIAGRMVFLASFAIREPVGNLALSNVLRISIAGLVRTLARKLGPHRIRVNGVLPGYIQTERVRHLFEDNARRAGTTPEAARARLESEIPVGRLGTPEELARTVLFLGSEMSAYVSGAMVPVDGALLRSVG